MNIKNKKEFYKLVEELNYEIIDGEYKNSSSHVTVKDRDGYLGIVTIQSLKNRTNFLKFSLKNPFTLNNINNYLKLNKNGKYTCISNKYLGNREMLMFKCQHCGTVFQNKWVNVYRKGNNRNGIQCPFCDGKTESNHAMILKQVFLHEYPDTIVEERSCINPKTNCSLPTDIVNHSLKIAIEIQSWFHEKEDQKIKDKIKKDFWQSKGYSFFDPDIRDYTILELIKLFFPKYNDIPDYIDTSFSRTLDITKAQKLLDEGLSPREVSEKINVNKHAIYDAMYSGKLHYPENYKSACFTRVVQLDIDKNYINVYESIIDAQDATGINKGNISSCIFMKRYYSGGFYWVPEKDYLENNYIIPKTRKRKEDYNYPVDQYDLKGNYIKTFNTVIEASKSIKDSCFKIEEVIDGKRKSCRGYKWKKSNKTIL